MRKEINRFPKGAVKPPASKSALHRAVICASLAQGESIIKNASSSEDIEATAKCMESLGAAINRSGGRLAVKGAGGRVNAGVTLDCGESGSTLRFLVPLAAVSGGETVFTGRGRLMQRPMDAFESELLKHGVKMRREDGALAVTGRLTSGEFKLTGNVSSQFVSGLLLALPLLSGDSVITMTSHLESAGYVDMTIDALARSGVFIERVENRYLVPGGQAYRPLTREIEADYSQAAFFLVAGALGCDCGCSGLSKASLQGDRRILEILQNGGAVIETRANGDVFVKPGEFRPQTVDASDIPDIVPPLAVFLSCCPGESRIVNAGRLRYKESDRLKAVATELNRIGGDVTECEDGLIIRGVPSFRGGGAHSWDDHRIAMMAAVAAIRSAGPVLLDNPGCVAKSYPNFWADFERTENKGA